MTADLLPLMNGCLIGALVGWMAWRQHRQLDELRALLRAQEVTMGNKLATLEQVTGFDALTGLRGQRWFENALAVALRERAYGKNCVRPHLPDEAQPTEATRQTRRNLQAKFARYRPIRWSRKVASTEAVPEEIPAETTERTEVTQRHAA